MTSDMLHTLAQLEPLVAQQPAAATLLSKLQESLQQQDRQRQMLALLTQDLHDAAYLSPELASKFNLNEWLDRFDQKCPVPELRRFSATTILKQGGPGETGIEFF